MLPIIKFLTGIHVTSILLSALVIAPVLVMLGALLPWPWHKRLYECADPCHSCYALLIVGLVFAVTWASSSGLDRTLQSDSEVPKEETIYQLVRVFVAVVVLGWLVGSVTKQLREVESGVIVLGALVVLLGARLFRLFTIK